MRGTLDHELRQKRLADARTYSLAYLISYAVNDPQKMPRFDKVFPDGPNRPQTDEEMLAAMREWVDVAQAVKGVA